MTDYPLAPLISLRVLRERSAERAVQAAEVSLTVARAEVKKRQKTLESWRVLMKAEAERRWLAILGTKTSVKGLELFREKLAQLDRRELDLTTELETAIREVESRISELDKAKFERLTRSKAREKLEQHRKIWQDEAAKEEQRLEDQEMEDYNRPSMDPQF